MKSGWIIVAVVVAVILLGARTVFAVKPGAFASNRPEMEYARRIVARIYAKFGYTLTVTSGEEPNAGHMAASLHYAGLAEDYRTRDVAPMHLSPMVSEIRAALGSDYDVVVESDHLHVEYDPA